MRGAALNELHHLLDGQPRRQIHQRMNVIRVCEIDLHVNPFLVGIAREDGWKALLPQPC